MSNLFLASRFDERVRRLALGVEPMDAVGSWRLRHPMQILVESAEPGLPAPRLIRHQSGLFVLTHDRGTPTTLTLRLCDQGESGDPPGYRAETERRRLVPRRLRVTIPSAHQADALPIARRARRPVVFPGAAYGVTDSLTGVRGRVEQGGVAVRWARVQARRPGAAPADPPVGRAQCDDRGEFLLLLAPAAAPLTTLEYPFELDLVAHAPLLPVPLPSQAERARDGLWDLPVEDLALTGAPDPVADGAFPPAGFGPASAPLRVTLDYGRLLVGGQVITL